MAPVIRLATDTDAAPILAIYAPLVRDTAISFELEPPSPEELRQRIQRTLDRFPWLVLEREGMVCGYAYATAHRARAAYQWSVDVSVYVHEDSRRAGVARALYGALFPILEWQGFCNAYAGIALPNPGSVGVHEVMGFEPIGVYRSVGYKLGKWHDVGWWHRALRPHAVAPAPPASLAAVIGSAAWDEALAAGLRWLKG